jgi:eukaryotic translation initiation factor 2C
MDLIRRLQENVAPAIFSPPACYDGRKNLFAPRLLPFENGALSQEVWAFSTFSSTRYPISCHIV